MVKRKRLRRSNKNITEKEAFELFKSGFNIGTGYGYTSERFPEGKGKEITNKELKELFQGQLEWKSRKR